MDSVRLKNTLAIDNSILNNGENVLMNDFNGNIIMEINNELISPTMKEIRT